MTSGNKSASGEDSLIARYFRPMATDPGAFGLDDDAAALKSTGDDIVEFVIAMPNQARGSGDRTLGFV